MRSNGRRKLFVLDTSVLIHDPDALQRFEEHDIVLPYVVIHELGGLLTAPNGRGTAALAVLRQLEQLRLVQPSLSDVPLGPDLGSLTVDTPLTHDLPAADDVPRALRDDLVIRCARRLREMRDEVVVVSKDLGLRIKAAAQGLDVEDYLNTKVKDWERRYTGLHPDTIVLPAAAGDGLQSDDVPTPPGLLENEFCYVELDGHGEMGRFLCRNRGGKLHMVPRKFRSIWGIRPRDDYQRMAMDVLLDEDVRCVALMGVAGGGKTLLTLAVGLEQIAQGEHETILAIKPVVPVGRRDIGYLKGDKDEKLQSWLMPVFDNLRVLQMHSGRSLDVDRMRQSGQLQMETLTYLRGRTLHGYWALLDEMQNTTRLEAVTALSRMGEKTKCVLLADVTQIDNPYVDAQSCGAAAAVESLKGSPLFAAVPLSVSQRSPFAQLVSERMQACAS